MSGLPTVLVIFPGRAVSFDECLDAGYERDDAV